MSESSNFELTFLIKAARQMEDLGYPVLGSNLRITSDDKVWVWAPDKSEYVRVCNEIAIHILKSRIWEAMRTWAGAWGLVDWSGETGISVWLRSRTETMHIHRSHFIWDAVAEIIKYEYTDEVRNG